MDAKATAKFILISPSKARIVINLIRGKSVGEAMAILRFTPKRAARIIEKVLKSAVANAENNLNLDADSLYVTEACVNEGPRMKRYHPRQRGQAFPIIKRMCHITVAVGQPARKEA